MSATNRPSSLRVIVVGAGVAGLTASHILQKANIDHVVLERGIVAPAEGASIAIYPHGMRILAQIGALEKAKAACAPMDRWKSRTPNGTTISDNGFFHYIKENHGHDILLLERREFLQVLYDTLPDQSFIHTGRKVVDIVEDQNGVEAHLSDGSVERGDLVIGCDGVNSRTRELMWDRANEIDPGTIPVSDKTAIKTTWKALIGVSSRCPELGQNEMTVVHNSGYSFLALTQPEKVFWFVFFKLDKPVSWPRRIRYTEADALATADSVSDNPISDTMVFGELFARRLRTALIPIEEGVLSRWYYGRTVLAGDAAHKVTPNIALGGNSTMESIVVLCNHLVKLEQSQQGARPSRAKLNAVFAAYQAMQEPRMRFVKTYSSQITKFQAWDGLLYRVAATWIAPFLPDRFVADDLGRLVRAASKLNFLPVPASFGRGSVPWVDAQDSDDALWDSGVPTPVEEEMEMAPKQRIAQLSKFFADKEGISELSKGRGGEASSLLSVIGAFGGLLSAFYFLMLSR